MNDEKIDRRKIRTRQLLRDALTTLIMTRGYEVITVQDITDQANLGRATFYLHFDDKADLLTHTLETMFDDLVAQMQGFRLEDFQQRPPGLRAFQHVQQNHALYKVLLNENVPYVVKRIRQYLTTVALRLIEAVAPDKHALTVPAPIIASHIAGSLYSLIVWWLENDMPHSPEYMAQAFVRLSQPGILRAIGLEGENF